MPPTRARKGAQRRMRRRHGEGRKRGQATGRASHGLEIRLHVKNPCYARSAALWLTVPMRRPSWNTAAVGQIVIASVFASSAGALSVACWWGVVPRALKSGEAGGLIPARVCSLLGASESRGTAAGAGAGAGAAPASSYRRLAFAGFFRPGKLASSAPRIAAREPVSSAPAFGCARRFCDCGGLLCVGTCLRAWPGSTDADPPGTKRGFPFLPMTVAPSPHVHVKASPSLKTSRRRRCFGNSGLGHLRPSVMRTRHTGRLLILFAVAGSCAKTRVKSALSCSNVLLCFVVRVRRARAGQSASPRAQVVLSARARARAARPPARPASARLAARPRRPTHPPASRARTGPPRAPTCPAPPAGHSPRHSPARPSTHNTRRSTYSK